MPRLVLNDVYPTQCGFGEKKGYEMFRKTHSNIKYLRGRGALGYCLKSSAISDIQVTRGKTHHTPLNMIDNDHVSPKSIITYITLCFDYLSRI